MGVPQGSILSVTLFGLKINSIVKAISPVVECSLYVDDFYRAMHMHKRGICRHPVSVRLSVCPSVTFVSCVKAHKDIFEIFSPSGSHTILVFPYQMRWRYSDGNPPPLPNGGVECKGGMKN